MDYTEMTLNELKEICRSNPSVYCGFSKFKKEDLIRFMLDCEHFINDYEVPRHDILIRLRDMDCLDRIIAEHGESTKDFLENCLDLTYKA